MINMNMPSIPTQNKLAKLRMMRDAINDLLDIMQLNKNQYGNVNMAKYKKMSRIIKSIKEEAFEVNKPVSQGI